MRLSSVAFVRWNPDPNESDKSRAEKYYMDFMRFGDDFKLEFLAQG